MSSVQTQSDVNPVTHRSLCGNICHLPMGPEFFLPYSAAMLTQSGSCLTLPVTLQRGGENASAPGNATFLSLQDTSFSHGVSELCVCWLVGEPLLLFFLLLSCIYLFCLRNRYFPAGRCSAGVWVKEKCQGTIFTQVMRKMGGGVIRSVEARV